jgi:hypothetical protein
LENSLHEKASGMALQEIEKFASNALEDISEEAAAVRWLLLMC